MEENVRSWRETDESMKFVMMPSGLTPSIDDVINRYQRHKNMLCSGRINYEDYRKSLSKMMMGKKGFIRSITSLCIVGSLKMVISRCDSGCEGTVEIPREIADSTLVPQWIDGLLVYSRIEDGDYAMLVRQPCLWSVGIQPVRIKITPADVVSHEGSEWSVNKSLKLPPGMCAPYGADFGGDEMTLFVLTKPNSILECQSFKWVYERLCYSALHVDNLYLIESGMLTQVSRICL
jgi:hypothetical protein